MRNLVLFIVAASIGLASVPVSDACGESGAVVATIQASAAVRVEHGVLGESTPCYAVTLEQNGTTIRGYVSDVTLPAVVEFERKRALESRVAIPEPPPVTAKDGKKASEPPPTGPPFEPWSGADIHGRRLQIGGAKATLVTFWSASNPAARRSAENIMNAEAEFRSRGIKVFGMAQALNLGRLDYYMDDMGLDYPVVLDRQGLAAKYGADASKGTTLVIDASNHIIASSSDPKAIHAAIVKLLSSE